MSEADLGHVAQEDAEQLRLELIAAGATMHYPAVALIVEGAVQGAAILGYKRPSSYEVLLRRRLLAFRRGIDDASSDGRLDDSGFAVLWKHSVGPPPGAFFRRLPGTSLVSFDQQGKVLIRDFTTGAEFRAPGWIDFVPSPDGRYFVTPGPSDSGLQFYDAQAVLERGRVGLGPTTKPLFQDTMMRDQYPSIGVLVQDPDGMRTIYRVVTSWFTGVAFRDYEIVRTRNGSHHVAALTSKQQLCPAHHLSTPVLSKDGKEVAARDERTGTTKLFRIGMAGECSEMLDLGRGTSKVGFSSDGMLLVYSAPEASNGVAAARSRTYVFNRAEMRSTAIPFTSSAGLVMPQIIGRDSLLVAVRESLSSRVVEFRLICCLR